MKKVAILGSTGSIGRNTLDVIRQHPDAFEVVALAAGRDVERLTEQVRRWRPKIVSVASGEAASALAARLRPEERPAIEVGSEGAATVAAGAGAEVVVAAIVGAAGLIPTFAAVQAGCLVALANKESLVIAGEVLVKAVRESGARILPVDSEHNAIHQCLRAGRADEIKRLLLTASGGPFRTATRQDLLHVTPKEALAHPTWIMGKKISIDSATLMNKGLEVIEATHLFNVPAQMVDVVVHPQSIVHSMVEFIDGSTMAQLGSHDMRHAIQYALSWPERRHASSAPMNLLDIGQLTFEAPNTEVFRCLSLAYQAVESGGDTPARLNAANEIAVEAFLQGRIAFLEIAEIIEATLANDPVRSVATVEDILEGDRRAREAAAKLIARG